MLPNVQWLRAFDNALQAVGLSLEMFVPMRNMDVLGTGDLRYEVVATGFPDETLAIVEGEGGRKRICVQKASKYRYFELPDMERHCLFTWIDQGSVGLPAMFWMYCCQKIRGAFHCDWFHRTWNNTRLALKRCGLQMVLVQATLIFNMFSGPFAGSANFRAIQDSADALSKYGDISDPLFLRLYEDLCIDAHGCLPAEFGTETHMQVVLDSLQQLSCFRAKPSKVKLCRWFSWMQAAEEFDKYCHGLPLVLLHLGMDKGFSNIDQLSSGQSLARVASGATNHVQEQSLAVQPENERAVARSSDWVSDAMKDKKKNKNTITLCTKCLMNELLIEMIRLVVVITKPIKTQHHEEVIKLKTKRGSIDWTSSMASGAYNDVLRATLRVLQQPKSLSAFGMEGTVGVNAGGAQSTEKERQLAQTSVSHRQVLVLRQSWLASKH
eukprot:3267357-Amphidinium_carterae.2